VVVVEVAVVVVVVVVVGVVIGVVAVGVTVKEVTTVGDRSAVSRGTTGTNT
jgi:hypothetical protein